MNAHNSVTTRVKATNVGIKFSIAYADKLKFRYWMPRPLFSQGIEKKRENPQFNLVFK